MDYKINEKSRYYEIELENGKIIKVDKIYINRQIENLNITLEDAIDIYLDDEGITENQEQNELDSQGKKIVKKLVKSEKAPAKKTQKERTAKENPEKEFIIAEIVKTLQQFDTITDINITNKAKNVEFKYNNHTFKVDLTQKREPKSVE